MQKSMSCKGQGHVKIKVILKSMPCKGQGHVKIKVMQKSRAGCPIYECTCNWQWNSV